MSRDATAVDVQQRRVPDSVRDLRGSSLHDLFGGWPAMDATHAAQPATTHPSQFSPAHHIPSYLHRSSYILLLHSPYGGRGWYCFHFNRRPCLRSLHYVGKQTSVASERVQFLQFNMLQDVSMRSRGQERIMISAESHK